jgi:hypothetical protein
MDAHGRSEHAPAQVITRLVRLDQKHGDNLSGGFDLSLLIVEARPSIGKGKRPTAAGGWQGTSQPADAECPSVKG